MVLSALKHYGSLPGPNQVTAQNVFQELKKNVVTNMARVSVLTFLGWQITFNFYFPVNFVGI